MSRPVALTVAGTDSGGGAGVTADLKTFEAHDVWGTVAVTAVTAQNTVGVQRVEAVEAALVRAQMASVAVDFEVRATKTGLLPTVEVVETVAAALRDLRLVRLVVDPVLIATSGDRLAGQDVAGAVRRWLLPLATVVTPNLHEASALAGFPVTDRSSMEAAARALAEAGAEVVMVKGGHLDDAGDGDGDGDSSPDLVLAGGRLAWVDGVRIPTGHTHGTGCVLSAAICAELARGMEPADACVAAKRFVEHAIAAGGPLGRGHGPVDPGWERRA